MASNINSQNIDQTYPIAGQDNDSQGFRDNFTNIATNFDIAKDEIEELQTTTVVTTDDNNLNGYKIENVQLLNVIETSVDNGNLIGSVTLDASIGSYHKMAIIGDLTLNYGQWPNGDGLTKMRVDISNNTGSTFVLSLSADIGEKELKQYNPLTSIINLPPGRYIYEISRINISGTSNIIVSPIVESPV